MQEQQQQIPKTLDDKSLAKCKKRMKRSWSKINNWKNSRVSQDKSVDFNKFTDSEKAEASQKMKRLKRIYTIGLMISFIGLGIAGISLAAAATILGGPLPLIIAGFAMPGVAFFGMFVSEVSKNMLLNKTMTARHLRVVEDGNFHAFVQKVFHNRGFNPSTYDMHDRQLHKIYLDTSKKLNQHNRSWTTIEEEELKELRTSEKIN